MADAGPFFEFFLSGSSPSFSFDGVFFGTERLRREFVRHVVLAWASKAVFGVEVYGSSLENGLNVCSTPFDPLRSFMSSVFNFCKC